MSIVFGKPREYANQRRVKNSKCGRFVCKVRRIEVEPTEAQAMMDLPLYDEDGRRLACAICLEYFDNPNHSIPNHSIERLQCCGQIMHTMCLQVFSYPTIILPPVIAQYLCLGLIPRCSHFFDECVVTAEAQSKTSRLAAKTSHLAFAARRSHLRSEHVGNTSSFGSRSKKRTWPRQSSPKSSWTYCSVPGVFPRPQSRLFFSTTPAANNLLQQHA